MAPERRPGTAARLDWAEAGRPYPGERSSGDLALVLERPQGALLAVVDALGHGAEAAAVAAQTAAALQRNAEEPVIPLLRAAHEELRGTRGAVLSLAVVNGRDDTLTWVGVGNVSGRLIRAAPGAAELPHNEALLLRGGILGTQLPPLYAAIVPIAAGDLLVFASDGLAPDWMSANVVPPEAPPAEIAAQLLRHYAVPNDDAVVLVARYLGPGGLAR